MRREIRGNEQRAEANAPVEVEPAKDEIVQAAEADRLSRLQTDLDDDPDAVLGGVDGESEPEPEGPAVVPSKARVRIPRKSRIKAEASK